MSAYVHPCACAYTCICIHVHRHTYMHTHTYAHAHIHAYMHTHIRIHAHTHLYTDRKSQQQRLDTSNNIIDTHTHPYTNECMYTHICIYTYAHNLQRMCHRCVRWYQKNICITHTAAQCAGAQNTCSKVHAKLTAKKARIHICIRFHMHTGNNTHAHRWHCSNTLKNG